MFCPNCGKEIQDGDKFCACCGAPVQNEQKKNDEHYHTFWELLSSVAKEVHNENKSFFTGQNYPHQETVCTFCGSDNTQMVVQNNTEINSKEYNLANGCCGMCLLGPFGLLCGMFGTGSKVKISNEVWWLCLKCGKRHLSQSSALEKTELLMKGLLGNSVIAGLIVAFIGGCIWQEGHGFMAFLVEFLLAVLIPLVLTSINYRVLSDALGYAIIDLLPGEKRKTYFHMILGAMVIIFLIAMIISANIV